MIRTAYVLSVTNVDKDRVCISALDGEKLFPVILFCKYTDLLGKGLDEFLVGKPYSDKGDNRYICAECDSTDDWFHIVFQFKVNYVFYKCKDGKFRTYLR